jgi:hypothetical protein
MVAFLAPWTEHTDISREWAQDIATALAACGLSQKAAALEMGIHYTDLSRQLAGVDPLNLWRLTSLPGEFWIALLAARAKRMGADLITAEQIALIKGAAAMGPRMLAAVLTQSRKEQAS